eukprot:99831_1
MIAMTCALNVRESSIRANWPAYPNNTRPCHGTLNCIQCGPHSGFNNLEIRLEGGGILRYKRSVQSAPHFNHGDVVIVESSVHRNRANNTQMPKRSMPAVVCSMGSPF